MNLIICFLFDSEEVALKTGLVVIENPPTVPCDCEIVNIEWSDFVDDNEDLEQLNNFSTKFHFRAHILERRFSAEFVEIVILLMAESIYDDPSDFGDPLSHKRFDN